MGHQLGKHRVLGQHRVNAVGTRPLKHISTHGALIDPGDQRLTLSLKLRRIEHFGNDAETLSIKRFLQSRHILIWQQRRQFLINRYIDAAKRLDFLEHLRSLASKGEQK